MDEDEEVSTSTADWNAEGEAGELPESSYRTFNPRCIGIYVERFQALALALADIHDEPTALAATEAEYAWASRQRGAPSMRDRYRSALCILKDLLGQGWVWRYRDHRLEIAPPDYTNPPRTMHDVARQKAAIRLSMTAERLAQLQKPSTVGFLAQVERPRRHNGRTVSVLDLMADGGDLACDLRAAAKLDGADRTKALSNAIRPYLQIVNDGARCEWTGIRLNDIWRYFRYSWSLPYFSTPGRNIFYLVRDAARPLHPVIGIAALGNSIVRLGDREAWIGWSVESVAARIRAYREKGKAGLEQTRSLANVLFSALDRGIEGVDASGLASRSELDNPSEELLGRLLDRARTSARLRVDRLRQHALTRAPNAPRLPRRSAPRDESQPMFLKALEDRPASLADQSVDALFDQKRASELAELLRAKRAFLAADFKSDPSAALAQILNEEEGRRAIGTAIKSIKKDHIGTSMMDVIICGAVPPYSHVLGGKLVCMLLTSPEVCRDYRDRYGQAPSGIASRMKGQLVTKPAELVFLGTTSLYHVGSSQYNRVRVPGRLAGGAGEIRYERLGATRGYGSVHFSERTRKLLEAVITAERGASLITRTFGEGVNPKFRLVREGLACVGLDADHLLQHQCRRIIYGIPLARNAREYLRGEASAPDYVLPAATAEEAKAVTEAIAEYWRTRWLSKRIASQAVLERVLRTDPDGSRMSGPMGDEGPGLLAHAEARKSPRDPLAPGPADPPSSAGAVGVAFVQQLYNHRSCYADRLNRDQLDAIHVNTKLEQFVLDRLRDGKDVVLTGNPGDGKTHLIMKLARELEAIGAVYHADATAEDSYDTIISDWQAVRAASKPFCLAINEWPLLEMIRGYSDRFAPLAEVGVQVDQGVVYDVAPPVTDATVVVVDLNLRTLVDRSILDALLSTLTADRFYPECPSCPARETCDVPRARRALAQNRVRERLFRLLELVAKRGRHVTMRDLQGFVAYLITGGRSCEQLVSAVEPLPYFAAAYDGSSDLFEAARSAFDPARVTHPLFDEGLWSGGIGPDGWLPGNPEPLPASAVPDDPMEAMRQAKRRFYFEHAEGEQLLSLVPRDERLFYDILNDASTQGEQVVRRLIGFMNRFFDPQERADSAVRLWSRHRYDARWSPAYISVRQVPANRFVVLKPRLSPLVEDALAYVPDHLLLQATGDDGIPVRLRVDLALVSTLYDAQRGLPLALRSPEILKRIDVFFNELARGFHADREVEDVHVKNFENGAELRFKVDRRNARYGA
jgi:hypothetical protein